MKLFNKKKKTKKEVTEQPAPTVKVKQKVPLGQRFESFFKILKYGVLIILAILIKAPISSCLSNCGGCKSCSNITLPDWWPDWLPGFGKKKDPDKVIEGNENNADIIIGYSKVTFEYPGLNVVYKISNGTSFGKDMPKDAEKVHYEFQDWLVKDTEPAIVFTSETTVTEDITVVPDFEYLECVITYQSTSRDEEGHLTYNYACEYAGCNGSSISVHDLNKNHAGKDVHGHDMYTYKCKYCEFELDGIFPAHIYLNGVCVKCDSTIPKDDGCQHEYEYGICKLCGEEQSYIAQPASFNIIDGECEHTYVDGECTKCGATESPGGNGGENEGEDPGGNEGGSGGNQGSGSDNSGNDEGDSHLDSCPTAAPVGTGLTVVDFERAADAPTYVNEKILATDCSYCLTNGYKDSFGDFKILFDLPKYVLDNGTFVVNHRTDNSLFFEIRVLKYDEYDWTIVNAEAKPYKSCSVDGFSYNSYIVGEYIVFDGTVSFNSGFFGTYSPTVDPFIIITADLGLDVSEYVELSDSVNAVTSGYDPIILKGAYLIYNNLAELEVCVKANIGYGLTYIYTKAGGVNSDIRDCDNNIAFGYVELYTYFFDTTNTPHVLKDDMMIYIGYRPANDTFDGTLTIVTDDGSYVEYKLLKLNEEGDYVIFFTCDNFVYNVEITCNACETNCATIKEFQQGRSGYVVVNFTCGDYETVLGCVFDFTISEE